MDNKALKLGIISGIISSLVVVIFIQPILGLIWRIVVSLGDAIHHGYVDNIYRNAALSERNLIGYVTCVFLLLPCLWMVAFSFTSAVTPSQPRPLRVMSRIISSAIPVGFAIGFIILLIAFSLSAGVTEISASFTQRLTVLAPLLTDQEYKVFKARWAKMRSRSDYDALVAAMDARAKELNITLPPVRTP